MLRFVFAGLLLISATIQVARSQGVGINGNGSAPHPSAILDVQDTTKGLLIPRLSETQRNAIANPANGLIILNTTTGCLNLWDGSNWRQSCFPCGFTPAITGSTQLCAGNSLNLSVNAPPGSTIAWTGPGSFTATTAAISIPNIQTSQAGTYQVVVTQNGCVSTPVTAVVAVNPALPTLTATSNSPVVIGANLQLNATTISNASYQWTGPNNFTSSSQNPLLTNAQTNMSGTYSVTAIAGGCTTNTATVSVTVSTQLFQTFTANGTFTVPSGVTQVRVLCVGGGGGGASGHQGGGGSGYVQTGTFSVTPGQSIAVTVGSGGNGAIAVNSTNDIIGISPGTSSSFGSLLTANGGQVVTSVNGGGQNGGSGGGGSCNGGSPGGNGGTGGGNGGPCNQPAGSGQGNYTSSLTQFIRNSITAGAGGIGGNSSHSGGGGGGGILINNAGPAGANGPQSWSGRGGNGYGGGGGAGGYEGSSNIRQAGGNGAAGVVYVEW